MRLVDSWAGRLPYGEGTRERGAMYGKSTIGLGLITIVLIAPCWAQGVSMTVGQREADIVGNDNFAIQLAIDEVAKNGGGEVVIQEGEYTCYNSVFLRDNVTLRGEGEVILRKNDGFVRELISDCGFYHDRVKVADPSEWEVGWGVMLQAQPEARGFFDNVRTIAAIEGNDLVLDSDVDGSDYTVAGGAVVANVFPLVAAYNCNNATVSNIICEGNKQNNPLLNGCRGGVIYFFKSEHCEIRDCVARNFNGDGMSWQVSPYTTVKGCTSYGNTGLGLHPGSGSHHTVIEHCEVYDNASVGMFLCWRVAQSRFENNHIHGNGSYGISIGHKDTDNLFRFNVIEKNAGHGVYLRNEPDYNAGHRCTFEKNRIRNNGGPEDAAIWIDGLTTGTRIFENEISDDRGDDAAAYAVYIGENASDVIARDNEISGFETVLKNDSMADDIQVQ